MKKISFQAEGGIQDLLDSFKTELFMTMKCHDIGKIQKFDKDKQTCTVKINYQKTLYKRSPSGDYSPVYVDYPLLVDCPVVMMLGGDSGLTFPIKKGDDCLVMYNDRDIDKWFEGATTGPVNSSRMHSISDGIALVGLRSGGKSLSNYSEDSAVLFYKETKVSVGENSCIIEKGNAKITVGEKIKIEVGGVSLKSILDGIIDAINSNPPLTTSPGVAVNSGAMIAALNAQKSIIQGVFE